MVKRIIKTILTSAIPIFAFSFYAGDHDESGQVRPNIIILLSDDQGFADVSAYEHAPNDIFTPNIDRIAQEGIKCTQAYVSAPLCSPSRSGIMTGRYQERFGSYTHRDARMGLPLEETTIATLLRNAGYATAHVGKWHLGFDQPYWPANRGFDESLGFIGGTDYFNPELVDGKEKVQASGYMTNILTDRSIDFIRRSQKSNKPFFLYSAFRVPHTPLEAPKEYIDKFAHVNDESRRIYLAMISCLDDNIGRILDELNKTGLEENTIVFFLTDNGGSGGNGSINKPLRSRKGQLWEGGIRTPFFVRWPARIEAGKIYNSPIISLDLLPTCVALAEGELPGDRDYDGKNLIPVLLGEQQGPLHEMLFWTHSEKEWGEQWAIRYGDWKLTHEDDTLHLSNLKNDPGETTNLAKQHPDILKFLNQEYTAWRSQMGEHRFKGKSKKE